MCVTKNRMKYRMELTVMSIVQTTRVRGTKPYLGVTLQQGLVVLRQSNQKEHGGHVVEAVDPFSEKSRKYCDCCQTELPALSALPADVDHSNGDLFQQERVLDNALCGDASTENVLLSRNVVGGGESVQRVEIAKYKYCMKVAYGAGPTSWVNLWLSLILTRSEPVNLKKGGNGTGRNRYLRTEREGNCTFVKPPSHIRTLPSHLL